MSDEQAQNRAVSLWGYRGATVAPNPGAVVPLYEVGRLYYLPSGGARFVAQGRGRSWRAAFRAALQVIPLLITLIAGCSACETRPPATLRLASLNMAGGAGPQWSTADCLARQTAFIAELAPDVLALQEVTDENLAALPVGGTLFHSGEVAVWARAGVALEDRQVIVLDYGAWVDGTFISEVPRTALSARAVAPDIAVTLSAAHLSTGARDQSGKDHDPAPIRAMQLDEATVFDPDVVIGDLNAFNKEIEETLGPLGYRAATRGAVDSVWLKSGERGTMEPTQGASDHPAAATVEIRRSR